MFSGRVEECQSGPPDEVDLMEEERRKERIRAARHRKFQTVRDIIRALERMDAGMFGVCEKCGNKISTSRLTAIPTASLCTHCEAETVM
jgi:DnaK suppressor protein